MANASFLIPFHYWMILGVCFWLVDLFRVHPFTKPLTFAAVGMGIVIYANPQTPFAWQAWGFFMLMAFSGIYYLKKLAPAGGRVDAMEKSRQENKDAVASSLVGTRITLEQPLFPGTSKLEVRGRYWKVKANRDFAAGSVIEITGHRDNVLEVVASSGPDPISRKVRGTDHGGVGLEDYQRDPKVERVYGEPDFGYWHLFREALVEHRKPALIYAYHLLSGLKGMSLDEARGQLNTYTLALYDTIYEGDYLNITREMYSQPRLYSFLYLDGPSTTRNPERFEAEMDAMVEALRTPWAARYRGEISADITQRVVGLIRKRGADLAG